MSIKESFKNALFYFNLLFYAPKIILRFIIYKLKKKHLKLQFFKSDSPYCINGTLNQLSWDVENAIFIILENSQKVFFGSNEQIFKVNDKRTIFKLKCFGIGGKMTAITSIKVIKISMTGFEQIKIRETRNHNINHHASSQNSALNRLNKKSPIQTLNTYKINANKLKFKEIKWPIHQFNKLKECNTLNDLRILKEKIK